MCRENDSVQLLLGSILANRNVVILCSEFSI